MRKSTTPQIGNSNMSKQRGDAQPFMTISEVDSHQEESFVNTRKKIQSQKQVSESAPQERVSIGLPNGN